MASVPGANGAPQTPLPSSPSSAHALPGVPDCRVVSSFAGLTLTKPSRNNHDWPTATASTLLAQTSGIDPKDFAWDQSTSWWTEATFVGAIGTTSIHANSNFVTTFSPLNDFLQGNAQTSSGCSFRERWWALHENCSHGSNLVNPNLMGSATLTQLTAISCIINIVYLFFSGIQDRLAGTPPMLSRRHVESSMRLSFKRPVIMSRTSLISSLHALATRTSPSCSTRTPLSLTLWCLPSRKTPQAKVRGVWSYSSIRGPLRRPSLSGTPNCHILFCAHPQCSGQET